MRDEIRERPDNILKRLLIQFQPDFFVICAPILMLQPVPPFVKVSLRNNLFPATKNQRRIFSSKPRTPTPLWHNVHYARRLPVKAATRFGESRRHVRAGSR